MFKIKLIKINNSDKKYLGTRFKVNSNHNVIFKFIKYNISNDKYIIEYFDKKTGEINSSLAKCNNEEIEKFFRIKQWIKTEEDYENK